MFTINEETANRFDMTLQEVCMLAVLSADHSTLPSITRLQDKGYISYTKKGLIEVSDEASDLLAYLLSPSSRCNGDDPASMGILAKDLMDIYPDTQPSTNRPARGTDKVVIQRLRMMCTEFDITPQHADVVNACHTYLNNLSNPLFLLTLPDFIFNPKDCKSVLADYLSASKSSTPLFPAYSNVATR